MPSTVPNYPNAIETSPDEVLERAKKRFPVTPDEIQAEEAKVAAEVAYQNFLVKVGKHTKDAGAPQGFSAGWGLAPPSFDVEREELEHDLSKATVRLNRIRAARNARIWAAWEADNAVEAQRAQREWQRRRGQ